MADQKQEQLQQIMAYIEENYIEYPGEISIQTLIKNGKVDFDKFAFQSDDAKETLQALLLAYSAAADDEEFVVEEEEQEVVVDEQAVQAVEAVQAVQEKEANENKKDVKKIMDYISENYIEYLDEKDESKLQTLITSGKVDFNKFSFESSPDEAKDTLEALLTAYSSATEISAKVKRQKKLAQTAQQFIEMDEDDIERPNLNHLVEGMHILVDLMENSAEAKRVLSRTKTFDQNTINENIETLKNKLINDIVKATGKEKDRVTTKVNSYIAENGEKDLPEKWYDFFPIFEEIQDLQKIVDLLTTIDDANALFAITHDDDITIDAEDILEFANMPRDDDDEETVLEDAGMLTCKNVKKLFNSFPDGTILSPSAAPDGELKERLKLYFKIKHYLFIKFIHEQIGVAENVINSDDEDEEQKAFTAKNEREQAARAQIAAEQRIKESRKRVMTSGLIGENLLEADKNYEILQELEERKQKKEQARVENIMKKFEEDFNAFLLTNPIVYDLGKKFPYSYYGALLKKYNLDNIDLLKYIQDLEFKDTVFVQTVKQSPEFQDFLAKKRSTATAAIAPASAAIAPTTTAVKKRRIALEPQPHNK